METSTQYDSLLGGCEELPSTLNLIKFSAARCKEIKEMRRYLMSQAGTKLAFQKLPKHMRRRTMSHNAKRLPRRLQKIHLNQLEKSGMPPKQNRPSRKYRRRPRNLLNDYERRRHKIKWLETHIWHAKRFHMVEKWGYKIADRPCDKAFRACYRATAKHCLLQDISYFSCIQMDGPRDFIVSKFKTICDTSVGLSIKAKAYEKGVREGQTVLFKHNSEPKKAIGTIFFSWRALDMDQNSCLWIWVHAAYYAEALNTLISCFHLTCSSTKSDLINPLSYIDENNIIQLKELRYELNRFRLTGPLSHSVLQSSLKITRSDIESEWFNAYLQNDENRQCFANQERYWKSINGLSNASQLPPHKIIALVVEDPRLTFPKKRTKAVSENSSVNIDALIDNSKDISVSPIWSHNVRETVKASKVSNAVIAEQRSQSLVPGSDIEVPGVPVPILLIQRPGNACGYIGYSSGWDVVIPAGWAQSFWLCFVMYGARTGGLRETNSLNFESGQPDFLLPDTTAGAEEEWNFTELCKEKYFRMPPNKRINYTKFAIASPFHFNWKMLIHDWNMKNLQDFFVLRNMNILHTLQQLLMGQNHTNSEIQIDYSMNCIIPVKLKVVSKGLPKRFAIICLATTHDLKCKLTEPTREDPNQQIRKDMRANHKCLLKKLQKRRKAAKDIGKKIPIDMDMLNAYKQKMRHLWLPEPTSIRYSCSREVMGFVTNGGFSFSLGHSCAIGYVTLGSLPTLFASKCKNKVLIRNTNCRKYRLAELEIITTGKLCS